MLHGVLAGLAVGSVVWSLAAEAQRRPDFGGTWVLVEALVSGSTRGAADAGGGGPVRTPTTTIGGAPFNCGRECTIVQKNQTLTVEAAKLADFPGKDPYQPTPAVTFHLDGRQAEVVNSFTPRQRIAVTAKWDGNTVQIESATEWLKRTQSLSLDGGRLVVVSVSMLNPGVAAGGRERRSELRMTYQKKELRARR
jgi:hypothetical protein